MPTLAVTLEIDGIFARRLECPEFDIGDLHPSRRQELITLFNGMLNAAAGQLDVPDDFVETMRAARKDMGEAEFEAMMADMDPILRPKLVAAGLLK